MPAGLSGVVAIGAGLNHNLALKADGTVVAWGRNVEGQASVPTGLSGVVAIAGGVYHSLALKADGTVIAWGDNADGRASVPAGLSRVVAIAAGGDHNLAMVNITQIGSLQVSLAPADAVSAGAQWQVDGGAWQSSGATVSDLSVGSHTIAFNTVSGWTTPASQTVTVNANLTTTATGTYVPIPKPTGTLQFSTANYSVSEGAGNVTITVTRTGGSTGSVSASYATANGTATAPGDYTAASGTLSWVDEEKANKTFMIPIIDDTTPESTESFTVTLTSATLGTPATASVTITEQPDSFVQRQLAAGYSPGSTFIVTLQATPPANTLVYGVEETPPAGWNVGIVNESGAYDTVNHKVKWTFLDGTARTLTYQVTPPANASGRQTFVGEGNLNGTESSVIGGMTTIDLAPYHPADVNPANWILPLSEVLTYAVGAQTW